MSCHGCTDSFGFLKKEYGCPNCKFSYCKKCLRFPMADPKTSKEIMVCLKCSQSVKKGAKEPIDVMSALHRLESMDDPAKPPITVYRQPMTRAGRLQELKRGLSVEDQHILERLESLKKDTEDLAENRRSNRKSSEKVEEEIAERLARLKGEEYNPEARAAATNFRNIKPQTEQDIIAKFTTEVELDAKYETSVVSDIESRLAKLRGEREGDAGAAQSQPGRSNFPAEDVDELTEAEQIERIMHQLKEELAIEQKFGEVETKEPAEGAPSADVQMHVESDDDDIDVDELCGICGDKRATLICKECDDDIFCKGCFKELHQDLGEMHAAKQFKPKK